MWDTLKKQLVEKLINEVKSKHIWNTLKEHIGDDTIDEFFIMPILNKITKDSSITAKFLSPNFPTFFIIIYITSTSNIPTN